MAPSAAEPQRRAIPPWPPSPPRRARLPGSITSPSTRSPRRTSSASQGFTSANSAIGQGTFRNPERKRFGDHRHHQLRERHAAGPDQRHQRLRRRRHRIDRQRRLRKRGVPSPFDFEQHRHLERHQHHEQPDEHRRRRGDAPNSAKVTSAPSASAPASRELRRPQSTPAPAATPARRTISTRSPSQPAAPSAPIRSSFSTPTPPGPPAPSASIPPTSISR